MSVAYFIVLDSEDPDFDPFVDGKMLAKYQDEVNALAERLGLKQFEDFLSQDLSEFDVPDMDDLWFEPSEGIKWVEVLIDHLKTNPEALPEAADVLEDLEDYLNVFKEAGSRGLKWHLELDF